MMASFHFGKEHGRQTSVEQQCQWMVDGWVKEIVVCRPLTTGVPNCGRKERENVIIISIMLPGGRYHWL